MTSIQISHKRWRYGSSHDLNVDQIQIENEEDHVDSIEIKVFDDNHQLKKTIEIDSLDHVEIK